MKILIAAVLSAFLFSCHKEADNQPPKVKHLEFIEDDFGVSKNLRVSGRGLKNKRPKNDTTIVTDPPVYAGPRVLKVDWDGEYVAGQPWNSGQSFYATPSSMPLFELYNVLDTVTKAYSSFKLTVTSDEDIYSLTPIEYRQKAVITDYSEWYGSAGGVAYRGSFGTGIFCFIFSKLLSNHTPYVGLGVTHEFGHTLGLPHKIINGTYSYDQNWMGAGFNFPYHIFEKDAPDMNGNPVDQFAVINETIK